MEVWKPIKNYEDKYEISTYGRIRSSQRTAKRNEDKIITLFINESGYPMVKLYNGAKRIGKKFRVHRLVAETFISNIDPQKEWVNHKDHDRTNNHVDNLEWCTPRENTHHMVKRLRTVEEVVQNLCPCCRNLILERLYIK